MSIINDTLKSPNGKWSRKNLTASASFLICIILGTYITLKPAIHSAAISVFDSFMILTGYLLGATVADKYMNKNN
jgi:hypothetical protein